MSLRRQHSERGQIVDSNQLFVVVVLIYLLSHLKPVLPIMSSVATLGFCLVRI